MTARPHKLTHAQLRAEILLAFGSRDDLLLWPNSVGVALTPDLKRIVRYGTPGAADILGVWRRRFIVVQRFAQQSFQPLEREVSITTGQAIAIEVKVGRDVQSKKQKVWQAAFEAMGGTYILARSVEDVAVVIGGSR